MAASILAAAVVALSACGGGSSDDGDVITLTVGHTGTEDNAFTIAFMPWAEAVTEATGGRVQFDHVYNGALCSFEDGVACVEDGIADIGSVVAAVAPDLVMQNLSQTPFNFLDRQAATDAHNLMYEQSDAMRAEADARNMEVLFSFAGEGPVIATKEPISGIDDIDGMSIRSAALTAPLVELGANPVAISLFESYESVERGVVEGLVLVLDSIVDFRLHELAPHIYDIGGYVGNYATVSFAMNKDVWNGLPEDIQEIMKSVTEELLPTYIDDVLRPEMVAACEVALASGAEVERLGPEAEVAAWAERQRVAQRQVWIDNATDRGVSDAEAIFDEFVDLYESVAPEESISTYEICQGVG